MSKMNILVVEDEELTRKCMELLLDRSGYAVTSVDNGADALELVAKKQFDIILMDYKLPGMDGIECSRMINAQRINVKVLLITAWDLNPRQKYVLKEAGVVGYVFKPINFDEVVSKIEQHISGE